ncbi:MAG: ornithine carbamoyltransferase [Planctomycetes bacterium]|nr:ornithine carbamoyltransferase [Planctomycetota bacterium]
MLTHFISLNDLTADQFRDLLAVAAYLKRRRAQGILESALAGKTLAMVFEKPSLRTRLSFEVAMTELGGRSLYIRGEEVGMGVREPTRDVARVLSRYVQGIMARVFKHQSILDLAAHGSVPVINGLSDECHPCQALADFLTIQEHLGAITGLRVVFIGDANNVARSLARAAVLAGSQLVLACPKNYAFTQADIASFGSAWGKQVIQVHDPVEAVAGAHVLYSDVWTSMGQEAEKAERLQAFHGYQINDTLIAKARGDVRIMHCLPAHRDEEITDSAVDHQRSIIFDQAENRMHAQKAILRLLMASDGAAVIAAART